MVPSSSTYFVIDGEFPASFGPISFLFISVYGTTVKGLSACIISSKSSILFIVLSEFDEELMIYVFFTNLGNRSMQVMQQLYIG